MECVYSGVIKCPEGSFTINVPLRGVEPTSAAEGIGRQWGVMIVPTGYIARDKTSLTRYGWHIEALEQAGAAFGKQFIFRAGLGAWAVPYAYQVMMRPNSDARYWDAAFVSALPRSAITGGLGLAPPYTSDYAAYYRDQFFQVTVEPDPEKLNQFRSRFENYGLLPPEGRLKNSPDKNAVITVTASGVEVRVPCELPYPAADGACPRARSSWSATIPHRCGTQPTPVRSEAGQWNLLPPDERGRASSARGRIESDMVRSMSQPQQQRRSG